LQSRIFSLNKDHGFKNKLMSLEDAISLISNGDTVAIGGTVITRDPFGAIWQIIKSEKRNLTVVRTMMSFEGIILAVSGVAKKLITSWIAIAGPFGVSKAFSELLASKKIDFEEWSHMGILLRFYAGAIGIPFIPTYTMIGSDILNKLNLKVMESPYGGGKVVLIPAIIPDVAVIHVQRADRFGNAQILGMPIQDKEIALASKKVIITAEEIVSEEYIRRNPEATDIPHFAVDAVVKLPLGAYPTECQGYYESDLNFLENLSRYDKEKGVEGINEFIEKYIYGKNDFNDFLKTVDPRELISIMYSMKELINGDNLI